MKRILTILLLIGLAHGQDLKRPTAQDATGAPATYGCGTGAGVSPSMDLAFDAAGLSTSSTLSQAAPYKSVKAVVRRFFTWQTPSGAYTSLNLNVNASSVGWFAASSGSGEGNACINYSLDGGHTWTNMVCDTGGTGWAQHTYSANLSTSQNLADVQVGICVSGVAAGAPGDIGGDSLQVFDIWTSGTSASAPTGNGSSAGQAHRTTVVVN